jgi:hypothetical protein
VGRFVPLRPNECRGLFDLVVQTLHDDSLAWP